MTAIDWGDYRQAIAEERTAYNAYVSLLHDLRTSKVRRAREAWIVAYSRRRRLQHRYAKELGITRHEVDHLFFAQGVSASRGARRAR